jgi:[acyl-carrier-protein] S-malonyltransferase
MRAFLFPGQGSQKVGMGKDLVEEYSLAGELYREADETLGFAISNVSFEGPEDELTKTQNAQLAILTYSHIAASILAGEKKIKPDMTAGHSLGEFSAILAAGMVSFRDMLKVVKKRGELMAAADPEGKGGMAAVLGLDDALVKKICEEVSKDKYVEPVNFNSPGQVVISGLKEGIDLAEPKLKEAGAKRVLKLSVSGAFHSRLMEKAADEFGRYLASVEFKKPGCAVMANATAGALDEKNVRELLTLQMKRPVLWTDLVRNMKNAGMTEAVEVGFGNVLSGLVKKIEPSVAMVSWNQLLV